MTPIIEGLSKAEMRVSMFMDPDPEQMTLVAACGAHRIELYTEFYATAYANGDAEAVLARYVATAEAAVAQGLDINAGHDLNLDNLPQFRQRVPMLAEVSKFGIRNRISRMAGFQ